MFGGAGVWRCSQSWLTQVIPYWKPLFFVGLSPLTRGTSEIWTSDFHLFQAGGHQDPFECPENMWRLLWVISRAPGSTGGRLWSSLVSDRS